MQTRCRAIPQTTHNPLCITIEGREWNIQTTIRDPTMHSQTITQQQHVHSLFPNRLLQRIRFILLLSLFFTFSLLQTNILFHKYIPHLSHITISIPDLLFFDKATTLCKPSILFPAFFTKRTWTINDFEIGMKIGSGRFGTFISQSITYSKSVSRTRTKIKVYRRHQSHIKERNRPGVLRQSHSK